MSERKLVGAVAELILAATLWGFGFIAAVWAFKAVDPFEMTFIRFALASGVTIPFILRFQRAFDFRSYLRLSLWPALCLFGAIVFQTWGLKYTTATKSGFITTLYVVFVPLLESLHQRRRIPVSLWACVGVALVGTSLIVNVGLHSVNFGDVLTLIAALFATFQIYYVGLTSSKVSRPFAFNSMQALWCALFSLPFLFHDNLPLKLASIGSWDVRAIMGILSLTFGSTVIAFSLQVRAQARLSTTVATLLCLLESPFAMVFAMYFLDERMGVIEATGAAMIFLSAIAASYIEATVQSGTRRRQKH